MGLESIFWIPFAIIMALIFFFAIALFGLFIFLKTYWFVVIIGAFWYWLYRESIQKKLQNLWHKKAYQITIVIVSSLVIASLFILGLYTGMVRSSEKIYSPDRDYFAQVREINGGATTDFNTGVTVVENNFLSQFGLVSAYMGMTGGVFNFNGSLSDLKVSWVDDKTIFLTCNSYDEIYSKKNRWKDIKIKYDETCRKN